MAYQGEEIAFNIEVYEDETESKPVNLDNVAEILIYVFTDGCRIAKLSKTAKEGFGRLTKTTTFQYGGIIQSTDTKYMAEGIIKMEIKIAYTSSALTDGTYDIIRSCTIGKLNKTLIKNIS